MFLGIGYVGIGYDKKDPIPFAIFSSIIMIGGFSIFTLTMGKNVPIYVQPFETGILFCSSFVFYVSMLIVSTKHYS